MQGVAANKPKLLAHADEILLAQRVQRLRSLEDAYAALLRDTEPAAPPPSPEDFDATYGTGRGTGTTKPERISRLAAIALDAPDDAAPRGPLGTPLPSAAAWASAAGLSAAALRGALAEGQAARANRGLQRRARRRRRAAAPALERRAPRRGDERGRPDAEGSIALIRAAERFDVGLGCRFSTCRSPPLPPAAGPAAPLPRPLPRSRPPPPTGSPRPSPSSPHRYATFWVARCASEDAPDQTRIVRLPSRLQENYRKIKRAQESLVTTQGGRAPTDDEVAAYLLADGETTLNAAKVREIVATVQARPHSLDASVMQRGGNTDQGERSLADTVIDHQAAPLEAAVVNSMLQESLKGLMGEHLTEAEAQALSLRFGVDDGTTRTIREVASMLGVTESSVKHLSFKALNKLRKPHIESQLREYLGDEGD